MKTPQTKAEALALLNCLLGDFDLLKSGEWSPDDASCDASMEAVTALIQFVEKL